MNAQVTSANRALAALAARYQAGGMAQDEFRAARRKILTQLSTREDITTPSALVRDVGQHRLECALPDDPLSALMLPSHRTVSAWWWVATGAALLLALGLVWWLVGAVEA